MLTESWVVTTEVHSYAKIHYNLWALQYVCYNSIRKGKNFLKTIILSKINHYFFFKCKEVVPMGGHPCLQGGDKGV